MLSFIGDYPCKLDAKGRFSLPSSFRKIVLSIPEKGFVMRKNVYEKCLDLYPMAAWKEQIDFFKKKLNIYNRQHATLIRELFRNTAEMNLDNNGRLLIPKRLLEILGAKNKVILAGQNDKIGIWSKANYETAVISGIDFMNLADKVLGNSDEKE